MAKLKETERGTPDKKTRKSSATNAANDLPPPPLKLLKDEDIYAVRSIYLNLPYFLKIIFGVCGQFHRNEMFKE